MRSIPPAMMTTVIEEEDMNKSELVSTIAQRTGQSEKTVNEVLNGFIEVVGETVAKGKDKVTIPGFNAPLCAEWSMTLPQNRLGISRRKLSPRAPLDRGAARPEKGFG